VHDYIDALHGAAKTDRAADAGIETKIGCHSASKDSRSYGCGVDVRIPFRIALIEMFKDGRALLFV
jgi:hypothetical protein